MTQKLTMRDLRCLVFTEIISGLVISGQGETATLCYKVASDWYRLSSTGYVQMIPLCPDHMAKQVAAVTMREKQWVHSRAERHRTIRALAVTMLVVAVYLLGIMAWLN